MTTRQARLTAHGLLLLTALRDTATPSTEATLYRALFGAGLGVDVAARVVDSLLARGLIERVGRVAVALTDGGSRCVEAHERKPAG
jgi:predicted transcriptional regulator